MNHDASIMFQEIEAHEEYDESRQKTTNELIKLINKDEYVAKLIELMYSLKNTSGEYKHAKRLCILNKKTKMM